MVKRTNISAFVALFFMLGLTVQYLLPGGVVSAAQITDRSLTLQAGATDGGSMPSGVVNHKFDFTIPSANDIGSIEFEYCTTASGACTTPAGLSTTGGGVSLSAQSGETGFTLDKTVQGVPFIHRTAAAPGSNPIAVSYTLAAVTNPSATNTTFYVRITTFESEDTTGSATDAGVVAASTATQITLTGNMPESLVFCTGETVSTTAGVPDCSTATAGAVAFNDLFSPQATAYASSQMAASTNAGFGYAITVRGPTLTSGGNTISAVGGTAEAPILGKLGGQFGLNLVDNAAPDVGADVDDAPNGTNFKGQATTPYATVDEFAFQANTVQQVAASDNTGAGPSDAQIFTVSYIVNVPGSQPAGTYSSTLTYICTPTF